MEKSKVRPYENVQTEKLWEGRNEYIDSLHPKDGWVNNAKSIFYIFGLIIAVSAAGSMIIYGIDFVNGTPLLVGGVAIYLWRKEERNRRFIKSEVNLMESELSYRGEGPMMRIWE